MTHSGDSHGRGASARPIFNRLAVLRAERGLSRHELAEAIGVNYQTIGYIERGDYNPSLDLVFRITEFFGLPVEAVFSREPFAPLSAAVYGRTPVRPPIPRPTS